MFMSVSLQNMFEAKEVSPSFFGNAFSRVVFASHSLALIKPFRDLKLLHYLELMLFGRRGIPGQK